MQLLQKSTVAAQFCPRNTSQSKDVGLVMMIKPYKQTSGLDF